MLLTVTLNLAIDKTYAVECLVPGSVQRIRRSTSLPGGKGINVARVAAVLGEEVVATGLAGGFNGRYIAEELKKESLPHDFTLIEGESRLCLNILDSEGKSTELLEPGPRVSPREIENFLAKYTKLSGLADVVVLSGSLPRGVGTDFYRELVTIAKGNGAKTMLDTSGESLKSGLAGAPYFVKPNREEFTSLLGKEVGEESELIEAIKAYLSQGIELFVLSLGAQGSIVGSPEGFYRVRPPQVAAVNPVGCGDALVAGFAAALCGKIPLPQAIRLATATAAANALQTGAGMVEKDQVAKLQGQVALERLL